MSARGTPRWRWSHDQVTRNYVSYNGSIAYNSIAKPSLVPRPFKRRRRKGLAHIAWAYAGVSIATGPVTIAIVRGFCMTCSSMDNKRRVYDSIRLPPIFLGSPGACAYQALSPPPLEGPGYEARQNPR